MALTLERLQHLMLNLQNALAVGVGEAVVQALQANLGQSGVGPKTEQGHKNMVEAFVKRIESFNGTGFQNWKFKFEMAVKAVQTGALDMLQTLETSEKEVCFSSEIEQQISSQIHFYLGAKTPVDLVKNVPSSNGEVHALGEGFGCKGSGLAHPFRVSATHVASTDTNLPNARKNGRARRAAT